MKVLIACEFSGVVRDAFIKKGHDAWSCDLLPGEGEYKERHLQMDVKHALTGYMHFTPMGAVVEPWDLMIAHPPCTYLSNSGVCHLGTNKDRWKDMIDGAVFFRELLNAPIDKIAIENPIIHGYAKKIIGQSQSQVVHPWMFGHTEKKATCLWLKGLPKLVETNNVKEETEALPKNQQQRLHYLPPSPDRWKIRSATYQGIADAMVEQWALPPQEQ